MKTWRFNSLTVVTILFLRKYFARGVEGANSHGQLGQGHTDDLAVPAELPSGAVSVADISSITGGGRHSLLVTKTGCVYCSGANYKGECCGKDQVQLSFYQVSLLSCHKVVQATAGWDFSVALTDEGRVFTWGSNSFGQLGVTDIPKSSVPVEVLIGTGNLVILQHSPGIVSQVAAGMRHCMALTGSGDVYVWGAGRRGQLGFTQFEKVPSKLENPTKLNGLNDVRLLVAGAFHSGALTVDGGLYIWGCNKYGQSTQLEHKMLTEPYKIPSCKLPISSDDDIKELHTGWSHLLILTVNNQVISWGRCDYGQLGRITQANPDRDNCDPNPQIINSLAHTVKQVCCGAEHSLAIIDGGSLVCWGWNEHGMCANGDEVNQLTPTLAQFPEQCQTLQMGSGAGHTFAICSSTLPTS